MNSLNALPSSSRKITSSVLLFFVCSCAFSQCGLSEDLSQVMIDGFTSPALRGNILYVGGTGPQNYSTIQEAINAASPGDTIFVYAFSSPYYEDLLVNKTLTLLGENKETTVIDGEFQDSVVQILADAVTIRGFTIQHCKNDWQHAGIILDDVHSNLLQNLIIRDNGIQGVMLKNSPSSQNCIRDCHILNTTYAICLRESSDISIVDNLLVGNENGLYVVNSERISIRGNTINNKWTGIHLEQSAEITITENKFMNNAHGIYFSNVTHCNVSYNELSESRWYAVWLWESSENSFTDNMFYKNQELGIYLSYSNKNHILRNTFLDNDAGIYVENSSRNVVCKNIFKNYHYNAYFVASSWEHCKNYWCCNYWDHPRFLPYSISGKLKREHIHISRVNWDWHPARRFVDVSSPSIVPMIQSRGSFDGSVLYVGGTGPGNYTTIQSAVDAATSGDTIFVYHGTYYEGVVVGKQIRLIGEERNSTIIDGSGYVDVVSLLADGVILNGFTIQNGHFGVALRNCSDCCICGNDILNNLHGISLWYCRHIRIRHNVLDNNVYGIRLYWTTDSEIHYNSLNSYKTNAFFFGSSPAQGRNHWNRNYWGQSRILPISIPGKLMGPVWSHSRLNYDWHPLLRPYLKSELFL